MRTSDIENDFYLRFLTFIRPQANTSDKTEKHIFVINGNKPL